MEHPVLGAVRQVGLPFTFSATPATHPDRPAAARGAHGRDPRGASATTRRRSAPSPRRASRDPPHDHLPHEPAPGRHRRPGNDPAPSWTRSSRPGSRATAVVVLAGEAGRDQLGRLGHDPNVLSRVVRLFQFFLMDQTPDFLVYEAAILDGRAVIAVPVAARERMLAASKVLVRHGGALPQPLRPARHRGGHPLEGRGAGDPRRPPALSETWFRRRPPRGGGRRRRRGTGSELDAGPGTRAGTRGWDAGAVLSSWGRRRRPGTRPGPRGRRS